MSATEGTAIAAFLNETVDGHLQTKVLVIAEKSALAREAFVGVDPTPAEIASDLPLATPAVISDFLNVAAASSNLYLQRSEIRANIRWRLASERSLAQIFEGASLRSSRSRFLRTYPNAAGLMRISRAGTDEESGQALFFVSMDHFRGLGGAAYFVLMQYQQGVWKTLARKMAWMS